MFGFVPLLALAKRKRKLSFGVHSWPELKEGAFSFDAQNKVRESPAVF